MPLPHQPVLDMMAHSHLLQFLVPPLALVTVKWESDPYHNVYAELFTLIIEAPFSNIYQL